MSDRGYALDMSSVVSHVATEMEGAGPDGPAPTVASMAATYRHAITADLARIRLHEGADSDHEAVLWLVRAAVSELGNHAVRDGDGYRLTAPLDEIRRNGRQVARSGRDEYAHLGDPFNPMTGGAFASNVRIGKAHKANPPEDDILRESMRENGWLPGHPAVVDERGVVVTGHRRLKIAQELGIEPRFEHIAFGTGDAADIARLKLAWWSNEGSKPYTPSDRQAVAAYLRDRGWTQASIAEALHTAQSTISEDLRRAERPSLIIDADNQNAQNGSIGPGSGSGGRRAGAGRPRTPKPPDPAVEARNAEIVRERDEEHLDWGEIAQRHGLKAKGAEDIYRRATGARGREPARAPDYVPPGVAPETDVPDTHASAVLEQMVGLALSVQREKRPWLISQLMTRLP